MSNKITRSQLKITNILEDSHHGQLDFGLNAFLGDQLVGKISYSEYEGSPSIKYIDVIETFRRRGVATALIHELQSLYPEKQIHIGMASGDGKNFFDSLPWYAINNPEVVVLRKQRDQFQCDFQLLKDRHDRGEKLSTDDFDKWNDLRDKIEDIDSRVGEMDAVFRIFSVNNEVMAEMAAVHLDTFARSLDDRFGNDDAIGVRFFITTHEGELINLSAGEFDAWYEANRDHVYNFQAEMPDGGVTNCTNYARHIRTTLEPEGHDVRIVGFANEDNPDCACVREDLHPGGHDFAIVDGRYLVDPWIRLVPMAREKIIYDLADDAEREAAIEVYGTPDHWLDLDNGLSFQLDTNPDAQTPSWL